MKSGLGDSSEKLPRKPDIKAMTNLTNETGGSQPLTSPTRLARDAASATLSQAKNNLLQLMDCYRGPTAQRTIELLAQGVECAVNALERLPVPPEVRH